MLVPSASAYLIRTEPKGSLCQTSWQRERMQQSEVASHRMPIICYLLIEKSLVTAKGPGRSLPSAKHERAEIVQINLTSLTSSMSTRKVLYRA